MASRTVRLVRRQVSRLHFNEVDDSFDPSHVLIIRSCIAHALHGWGARGHLLARMALRGFGQKRRLFRPFFGQKRPLLRVLLRGGGARSFLDIIRLVVRWGSLENSLLMVGTVHTVTDTLQSPGVIMETIFIRLLLQASSG